MRTFLLGLVVLLALVSVHAADMGGSEAVEWIEPAFVESLDSVHEVITPQPPARAWHRTSSNELAPEHHAFAEQSASLQTEVSTESEMSVASQLAATITAEGKTEAELMAEIEVRGPHLWEEFKAYFKRKYTNDLAKYTAFALNLVRIAKLNANALFSKVPRKLRAVYSHLTPHADLTAAEFKALLTHKVDPKSIGKVAPRAVPRTRITGAGRAIGPNRLAPHTTFVETETEIESEVQDTACWIGSGDSLQQGTCIDVNTCTGTPYSGHCPGAANIKCCIVNSAPVQPPTPPAPVVQPVQPIAPVPAPVAPVAPPAAPRAPVDPDAPLDVDYRAQSTPIKAQGQCGSCYAFASVTVVETVWNLRHGQLYTLSPQQLLDCTNGCSGGSPYNALSWLEQNGGAVTEALMPYQEKATGTCTMAKDKMPAGSTPIMPKSVEWAIDIGTPKQDEKELGHQLSSSGPITIALDATAFQLYKSGVIGSEATCSSDPSKADHAVTLEGLGTDASTGQRYWILRNQWDTWWGETGRARVAYGSNICGVANWPIKITV